VHAEPLLTSPRRFRRPTLDLGLRSAAGGLTISLLVVATSVLSVYSTRTLVQLIAGVVLVFIAFRWLLWGTVIFIFLSFPVVLPGFLGAGASVSKPLGVIIICSWLLRLISDHTRPVLARDHPAPTAFFVAYVTWAIVSLLWTADSGKTVYELERLIPVFFLSMVVYSVTKTRRDLLIVVGGYIVTSALWAAYALATGTAVEGNRLTGGLNDPNYFAAELVLAVIAGGFLIGATRSLHVRALVLTCVVVDLIAFILTQSRGGIVGMAVGMAVAIAVAGRSRGVVVALIAMAIALTVAYVAIAAPAGVRHRITAFSSNQSSGRTGSWQIAWKVFEHHPVNGVGVGAFQVVQLGYVSTVNLQFVGQVLDQQLVAHNTYLEILSELGLVGMLFLGGGVVLVFTAGRRSLRTSGDAPAEAYVLRGLLAGTAGLLGAFVFVSAEYEKSLWIAIALIAASSRILALEGARDVALDQRVAPSGRRTPSLSLLGNA
jgi:O-antigen ligase